MALQVMNIPTPGFLGIAKDRSAFPMGPEWAAEAMNLVIDANGRISARKGWVAVNEAEIDSGAAVSQIHEYINASGTSEIIFSTTTKLWSGLATPTDKTGSLVFTDGNWKFVNFNGYVLGWKSGEVPIQYNGTGNFAAISGASGTVPDGNTALAAFGRVWALDDDKQTIRYCALLDHTLWAAEDGGGVIDMRTVWTQGMDEVVAIASFGSRLVVFGRRHIIVWQDGSGSQLGLSPLNMYVTDTIDNVGAVSRDAVVVVGEVDVVFWSESGIRSLVRTLQERATPVNDLSPPNRNYIATGKATATLSSIRSCYSPQEGLVLFVSPVLERTFVFDVRQPIPGGGYRMFEWGIEPSALAVTVAGSMYFGFLGDIGLYSGYDDNDESFQFQFESGWLDIKGQESRKQALKALKVFAYAEAEHAVQFRWGVDFGPLTKSVTTSIGQDGTASLWGVAEWGVGLFGPAGAVYPDRVPLAREAEYFKIRLTTDIDGSVFAMQPLTLYTRPTRLA